MSRYTRMQSELSDPAYVHEYRSASAAATEYVKGGVVFLGSLVLDGFGIEHLVSGSTGTGIKELAGGVALGLMSAGYSVMNLRAHRESFQHAQELEAEYKAQLSVNLACN